MSRFRQRAVLVGCVLAALLAAAGLFVTDYGIEPDLWLSGLAVGFLAFLAAVDPWLHRRKAAGLATDDNLDAAARALAVALHSQWTEECRDRGLGEDILDLHWSSLNGRPGRSDAVVGAFERQSRLVFVGEAGAGKSTIAMLLTIGLLDRFTGGPVPFLLSLSTWDPDAEDVRTWMTRRLYEEHPALRNTELYGSYAGDLLVEQRRVFPILDGLDRIPAGKRAQALERINRAFPVSVPLVLTSRVDEFHETGVDVAGADVVQLHPLDHEEIAGYLRAHADPVTAARWEPIFLHLRAEPDGRLADALSTPLAVWLAGVVYAYGEPSELLDRGRFPDRQSIECHLVDALVAGAFGDRGAAHQARASQVWPRDKATRWLTFLAAEMRARDITDLAWWELRRSVGKLWLAVLGAVVLGSIGGLGVGWLMVYASTPKLAPVTGLAAGLAVAVAALYASGRRELKPRLGIWRSLVVVSGVLGMAIGLVFGALYGLSAGLVVGLGLAVAVALGFALGSSAELTHPSSPKWTMARDRIAVWTGSLVLAVVFGAAAGLVFGPNQTGMVGLGLACGLMLGFTLSVLHLRWWWFTVARVWLALRGRLPWELMVFLDDARKLGVLRQAGACYQFRHVLVQERLAGARPPVRSDA
ncbi:MFS family permease [Saccharothrix tamanrassetensis]|uniref:MFS family permease n=1 Tax=Saccharothrix tamanrassetensis TaxID=1051531 RepID=A0A841CBR8_9PSEU|nr:NACHT domain-containing protein [Saccharothrix tamanrassetensis]MBB5954671.1 MFS family permease [Saccharothrix tamanrassetensis]